MMDIVNVIAEFVKFFGSHAFVAIGHDAAKVHKAGFGWMPPFLPRLFIELQVYINQQDNVVLRKRG